MEPLSISIVVAPDGRTQGRSWRDGAQRDGRRVDLTGLDGRVLRLFERWLTDERAWSFDDIRVFGQLLHRQLFSDQLWNWVEEQIDARGPDLVRLQLAFPVDAASSRLATLPWEFLCAPDRPGRDGRFLVLMPELMLSRSVPPGTPRRASVQTECVRVLPVVGVADDEWLGPVDYQPVLDEITASGRRTEFVVLDPAHGVTAEALAGVVAHARPHLVHYIGHGRFDPATGRGAVALCARDGGTKWVDEDHLARLLCTEEWTPAIVVLHACEGGRTDYEYRHAGLAPGLVRQGVQCVVAMQYSVTNETATAFSAELYAALAQGRYLDAAVQSARDAIWRAERDARLLGVPMIYQRNAAPLLGARAAGAEMR
jgi:hypothetical protein